MGIDDGGKRRRGQGRPGDKKDLQEMRSCESVGVMSVEWLVIRVGGKVSSPNAMRLRI